MRRPIEFPIAFHLLAYTVGQRSTESDLAIVESCTRFAREHERHLRWFVDDRAGRFKPFEAEQIRATEEYLRDLPDAPHRAWMAHGGESKLTPSPWSVFGSLSGKFSNGMQLRWPIDYWKADWTKAVSEVIQHIKGRPIVQARAGHCFAEVQGEGCHEGERAILAARFQGVDIAPVSSGRIWAARGLGSATWLTAIGNVFVEQLGGRKAFASLGDDIVVHELGTGVMIQAGEKPSLGDVNAGDTMPLYREVAKLIMPARYHGTVIWTNVMPADAKAWLARLDP